MADSFLIDKIYFNEQIKVRTNYNENKVNYRLFEYYENLDIYKYLKSPLISMVLQIENNTFENKIKTFLNQVHNLKKKIILKYIK